MDIRMQEYPFEFDGKSFVLRCNMNVLAELQESNGGTIPNIFDEKNTLNNFLAYLSAMMNDFAEEQGWPERYTPKQLGRKIALADGVLISEVLNLVIRANYVESDSDTEQDSKN